MAKVGGTETILVAEDDEMVREFVAAILRALGYTVLVATNGREAAGIFHRHEGSIELVLSDLYMPELGGAELCEEISKLRPDVKFLFMTGYGSVTKAAISAISKKRPVLRKPFDIQALADRVRQVLDAPVTGTS